MKHSQSKRFIFVPLNSSQPLRKDLEPTIESINYQQFKTIMSNLSVLKTLVLASAALIGLTSCEKDNGPSVSDVPGTYSGQMTVSVGDVPGEPFTDEVIISSVSGNTVSITIEDFSFMGLSLGDVSLPECTLTENGDGFSISGGDTLELALGNMTMTAEAEITSGSYLNDAISLELAINAELLGQPMEVTVTFEGTKPAAE